MRAIDVQDAPRDHNADGVYLFQSGDYRSARESFQAALALQPTDTGLLYNVGQCYDRQGELAKAERYYQECLQRAPNHTECRHALAAVLVREGRAADAQHMIQDWIARGPGWRRPTQRKATSCTRPATCRAQARLQQALQLDPHEPQALIELAVVYEAMQRPDRAVPVYECAGTKPTPARSYPPPEPAPVAGSRPAPPGKNYRKRPTPFSFPCQRTLTRAAGVR